jgi:hypothetical protein
MGNDAKTSLMKTWSESTSFDWYTQFAKTRTYCLITKLFLLQLHLATAWCLGPFPDSP